MVGFYKHDIPAWMDGTEALSDGAYRAYHVILQLIMLNEGPIARNDRGIAGRCNQTLKTFSRNLAELIAARKLCLVDGKLDNGRAATELEAIRANRLNAAKGGKISRKPEKISENFEKTPANSGKTQESSNDRQAKSLENQDPGEASLKGDVSLKEKRREDYTPIVPKGTDAGFDRFRAAYPKRNVAFPTTQARKRYTEAIKRGATSDEIEAGARAYAAEQTRIGKTGTEFVKTADVWLNQNRWRDYARQANEQLGAPAPDPNPDQDRRHRLRLAIDHFRDEWRQGTDERYRPGTAGCTTAPDIVEEARLAVATERILTERPLATNAA